VYERFFGLADTPFRLTPDPRYLFLSARHADALAHLKLGLTESSGFVCITGDVGTGKTTLLRHFLTTLGPDVSTAYVFNPALTPLELLQTINAEFGLPSASPSKTELLRDLNAHLLAQHAAGRRAIVVIDEAQALDLEVLEQLRLLSNLETTTEKLLRIILVGQPQLRTILQHPDLAQLNQRITLRWHIGPLDRAESAAYVNHRIDVASGESGRQLFSRHALRLIHRYAGGVPRLLNMMAHRSLLAAYAKERQRVTARSVRQAHREVSTVPLPGHAPRASWVPRLAFGAAAVAGVLALGAFAFERWRLLRVVTEIALAPGTLGPSEPPGGDTPDAGTAGASDATPPAPASAPAATAPAVEPAAVAAPALSETPPSGTSAPVLAIPIAEGDAEEQAAPGEQAERTLVDAPAAETAHEAMAQQLAAWSTDALGPGEVESAAEFPAAAERRGLEHVVLNGNASMLRLLDVPAILELHFPSGSGLRYATLVAIDGADWVLAAGGRRFHVDDEFLRRYWYGFAHLVWRDAERLGPSDLGPGDSGPAVTRLQELLRRAGSYSGPTSGRFDEATSEAVLSFQRAHFLETDGWVGPLTRLSLYATGGPDGRPSLASSDEGRRVS
jgi:general secretion pathway protein A